MEGTPDFNWIHLYSLPEWNSIEKSHNVAGSKYSATFKMNHKYNLSDKFYLINIFAKGIYSEKKHKDSTYESIWLEMFTHSCEK